MNKAKTELNAKVLTGSNAVQDFLGWMACMINADKMIVHLSMTGIGKLQSYAFASINTSLDGVQMANLANLVISFHSVTLIAINHRDDVWTITFLTE